MRKSSQIFRSVFRTTITMGLSSARLPSSHLFPHLLAQERIFKDRVFIDSGFPLLHSAI